MVLDNKLLEIIVCPQCKGSIESCDGGHSLLCKACQLKFPVREDIPVMIIEEAVNVNGTRPQTGGKLSSHVVAFRIISGPNKGLVFHLEKGTCKAIGRSMSDPNKTNMFNVDVSLSLDEGTKGLIQSYISKQFKDAKKQESSAPKSAAMGNFKRTSDVVLDDVAISRLHSMIFFGDIGVGILDLVSKNGTYVNGEEIESRLLKKGDAIEMGETKIVYEG